MVTATGRVQFFRIQKSFEVLPQSLIWATLWTLSFLVEVS
jgi:hypothetical protein